MSSSTAPGGSPRRTRRRPPRPSAADVERAHRALRARGTLVERGPLALRVVVTHPDDVRTEEVALTVETLDAFWRRFALPAWRMRVVLCWGLMPAVLEASEMEPDEPGHLTAGLYLVRWTGRAMPTLVLDCALMERVGVWRDRALSLVETVAHEAMHAVQQVTARAEGEPWPPIEARLFGEAGNASYDAECEIESAAFMCALAESTGGNVRHAYCGDGPHAPSDEDIARWAEGDLAPLCARMLVFRHEMSQARDEAPARTGTRVRREAERP